MKQRILFVHDDSNLLCGMKRLLYPLRNEWEMMFVHSGAEALAHLARAPVDVVITDMRMSGIDGNQLLTEVMRRRPEIVRIVLSGQASQDSMNRALTSAHQYLAKPCDTDTLKAAVKRATALQRLLPDPSLGALVTGISTLPSPPDLYAAVTEALAAPTPALQTISQLIAKDIGMTAKILHLVNSALFGLPHRVSDIFRAVSLLGIDTVKKLVLSQHIFSPCTETTARRFALPHVWDHSFIVASYAKRIAQAEQQDSTLSEAAFTAGMLHDCGALVVAATVPDAYKQAQVLAHESRMSLWEAEHQVFGDRKSVV
jgi:CheY-like chemotaxis protein